MILARFRSSSGSDSVMFRLPIASPLHVKQCSTCLRVTAQQDLLKNLVGPPSRPAGIELGGRRAVPMGRPTRRAPCPRSAVTQGNLTRRVHPAPARSTHKYTTGPPPIQAPA